MSDIDYDPSYDLPQIGSFTAISQTFELDPLQKDTQAVSILGTWAGTIVFEASNDGSNYFSIQGFNVATNSLVSSTTANGNFILLTAGYSKTRLRASAFTSGTANLSNEGSHGVQVLIATSPNAASFLATVSQSGTWNINNISGTVSLPTGAATSANQTTEIASLQILDNVIGPVTPGAVATNSSLIGAQYNATLPTLTDTQQAALQVDSNSRLIVAPTQVSPLPATGSGFSFGEVTTAAANTLAIIQKTVYTEQTTNGQRSIASANAADAAAGTGARTVLLTYFDQTLAGPFTETLTLNGTTGVNTVATNICYIEKIQVETVGSTGSNVGIITLYTAINKGGSVIGTITATYNRTAWAHHYVPVGKTCYISGFSVNNSSTAGGNGALFQLRSRNPLISTSAIKQVSDIHRLYGQDSTASRIYNSPIQVAGPSLIRAYVSPESNTSVVQRAAFDYIDN